ncbi:L-threonine dehydratase catabolic TdcB-like [Dreissena polymorpha]|uniref:L-threonine dehydratase catabolic TdcB-like n=1 Tax=Dreissena polymorpha TaxID=45954 RepID=UPI0022642F80|nr:L-threonine dehydratase catabolic TdcB-like [Dreissena polymorpha]XP_052211944.1 L-threonine dehydratase catabolic TdcB-like [Dreissena polymorpha]
MEFTVDKLGDKVQEAYTRIKSHVWKTPLMYSLYLSTEGQAEVYLKLESEQLTGSFKLRGAFNKLLTLNKKPDQLKRGITTASSGNHGLACIAACKACNVPLEVFVSEEVNPTKLQNMRHHGVKVTLHGHDCVDAEIMARQTAAETGKLYISPYNDVDVMAGNGTVGCEIHNDLPEVDYVFVSVGGGGFIGGIAAYLKKVNPKIQVIGCQPRNSKVMYESVKVGYIKHDESLATLSDGTSGDIEDGSITFEPCRRYVDDWILVDEHQIADAIFLVLDKHHKVVEGSAAVAVAAFLSDKQRFRGSKVVLVMCGGNIATDTIREILKTHT